MSGMAISLNSGMASSSFWLYTLAGRARDIKLATVELASEAVIHHYRTISARRKYPHIHNAILFDQPAVRDYHPLPEYGTFIPLICHI